jgi:hypothetical protein
MILPRKVKDIIGKQTSHSNIGGALNWRNNQRKTAERNKREKINQTKKHLDLLTVRTVIINQKIRGLRVPNFLIELCFLILIIVSCLKSLKWYFLHDR